jgi:hypothetical protein
VTRILLDTNIFISYLLNPHAERPATQIVQAGVLGVFTLLLPEALLEEMSARITSKPYLKARIEPGEAAQFTAILRSIAETIARIEAPIPAVMRDSKDDFLLAYAVVGRANYLLTGDEDLLVLQQVQGVVICTPSEFAATQLPRLLGSQPDSPRG